MNRNQPHSAAAQYVDEGLRVLLAEDFFIYVVRESDGLLFVYETEMWSDWLDVPENSPVSALIPIAHHHQPYPLAKYCFNFCHARNVSEQMTLAEWEADHSAESGAA